jgi:anti-sigma regulatory factor (Ser/Thr protein kinase)
VGVLLELRFPAVPESCARARREVCAALDGLGLDLWAVGLAVSEAVTNAVVHAYRDRVGDSDDERFEVRLKVDADGVWVIVADDGVGMSPRPDSPGLGLGLNVIAQVTDQLLVVQGDTGTRVHMRFGFVDDGADER